MAEDPTKHVIKIFVKELIDLERELDEQKEEVEKWRSSLLEEKRIIVVGSGRSGNRGKDFAMRLMHLGYDVRVVGETTTPAVSSGDAVVAISGSGETRAAVIAAEVAKEVGATVYTVTSYPESPLGGYADYMVVITGREKENSVYDYDREQLKPETRRRTPLGTIFEMKAGAYLDGVIAYLMEKRDVTEEDMRRRHANVEL